MTSPEGHPGQQAHTFVIRILSPSLTSVLIFSVCCSRYVCLWLTPLMTSWPTAQVCVPTWRSGQLARATCTTWDSSWASAPMISWSITQQESRSRDFWAWTNELIDTNPKWLLFFKIDLQEYFPTLFCLSADELYKTPPTHLVFTMYSIY
jgi:hypothetical protein